MSEREDSGTMTLAQAIERVAQYHRPGPGSPIAIVLDAARWTAKNWPNVYRIDCERLAANPKEDTDAR